MRIRLSLLFLCVLYTSFVNSTPWWNTDIGVAVIDQCPDVPHCICQANNTIADCQHQNLTTFPNKLPTNVQFLRLGWNQVTEIPTRAFESFPNLVELSIEYNQITNVSEHAFEGLQHLKSLILTGNKIRYTDIFQKSLKPLTQLRVLEIQQNVAGFDEEIFPVLALYGMKQLQNLSVDLLDGNVTGYSLQSVKHLAVKYMNNARCNIEVVRRHMLPQLVPMASSVTLQNCSIRVIESGSFEELRSLETLDLSFNEYMGFKVMANVTRGLSNTTFSRLVLTQVHPPVGDCITLTKEFVLPISNLSLKTLILNTNRLSSIKEPLVKRMPKTLEELDASDNQLILNTYILDLIKQNIVDNLRVLNVSNQGINHYLSERHYQLKRSAGNYPRQTRSGDIPEIRYPSINENDTYRSCLTVFHLPPKLEVLDFSSSKLDISLDMDICVFNQYNLRQVDFSNNRFREIKGRVKGLLSLETLDLSSNSCKKIGRNIFHNVQSLQHLNLARNFLSLDIEGDHGGVIFSQLGNLKTLDLSHNQIRMLPPDIFKGLTSLMGLKLSGNRIKQFDIHMTQLTSLKLLLLNQNVLMSLNKTVTGKLDKDENVQIDLSDNQLRCICKTQYFVHWLATAHVDFLYINEYKCSFPDGSSMTFTKPKDVYEHLVNYCRDNTPMTIIISLSIFGIVIITAAAFIYRYRWNLRYMYYYAKFRFKGYIQLHNNDDTYDFDAFVCYSDHEKSFLIDKLIPELEEKRKLRLCVHERDFRGGTSVTANIVRAVGTSKKTLLLMSKHFTRSDWCKLEMNVARLEGIYTNRDVLCVIKMDEFDISRLPLEIMEVMRSQTYVELPKREDHMNVFWDRVENAISQ